VQARGRSRHGRRAGSLILSVGWDNPAPCRFP
jgi:hypothetical protein